MKCFKSKVAIITGGGSGIGEALCTALIQREAIVYVADVDYDNAENVASQQYGNGSKSGCIAFIRLLLPSFSEERLRNLEKLALRSRGKL